ncbi:N-acetylmuramoyl-L-alanine amidase [bacterium]|nr:N-acetylmuramoyl-L-alanine amidase [bacterium]
MKYRVFILVLFSVFSVLAQTSLSDSDMDAMDQLISDLVKSSKNEKKQEKKPEKKPAKYQKTEKKQDGKLVKTAKDKKLIVIDPGHGGKDPGAISGRIQEKDVVLKLAKKIEKLSKNYKNIEVKLTRNTDVFLPLEERAVIANKMNGDLFISLHANSFTKDKNVGGMEIYHLDNTRDEYANKLARVENKISENTSLLDTILVDMDISYYVGDSLDYASEIGNGLKKDLKKYEVKLRGYEKGALFYVLVGARMPSLLFEIGYLTNKTDRELLQKDEYLEVMAKSLLDSLSASKVK